MKQGKVIVITAPSGSGKTTLVRRLLASNPRLRFSVSACTRKPRAGEVDGKDYYFLSEEDFRRRIDQNAFAEWEMVYAGKYYGTLKAELQRIWDEGSLPLVDIDVKGAMSIAAAYPEDCLTVFIEAPSMEVLKQRLEGRGTETPETLKERLEKAAYELSFRGKFDKVIVNDDLEKASGELELVVRDFIGV